MKLKLNLIVIGILSIMGLVFHSCTDETNEIPEVNTDLQPVNQKSEWVQYLLSQPNWSTPDFDYQNDDLTNNEQEVSFRAKYCGWEGHGMIDCTGGKCFTTSGGGHDACIGCTVSDEMACLGSDGLVIIIMNNAVQLFPDLSIEFSTYDSLGQELAFINGELSEAIDSVNILAANQNAASYFLRTNP